MVSSHISIYSSGDRWRFLWSEADFSGLRYTSVWNSAAIQTSDLATAINAGIQKTTPRFEKL